jgi:Protein of unknown function (DUF2752)
MRLGILLRAIIAAAIIVLVIALCFFDPATTHGFPKCPFLLITGLQCPGCGSLRASYQLLHGNINAAWHYNPALFFAVAAIIIDIIGQRVNPGRPIARFVHSAAWPISLLALTIIWWIARNFIS